ncbi:nucleotidyltransferase domain-containing protein [Candidatus Bathyarchaeota archaeon]|nr:nucleotidyltransferase domain-containing protein [Candidatus Bathyarchaeota archaeon]
MDSNYMNERAWQVSKAFSRQLVEQGAKAVVLFGSWVRGGTYKESDLDILALGRGPHYRLERYQDFLISISWATVKQVRQSFKDCGSVGGVIPAWRNAVIIYDPKKIASKLKQETIEWQWDFLGKRVDRWVAEELTSYAEEVHKLVGNLQLKRKSAAAIQRSLLAIYMAPILAVHHRILYDTENKLWDLVSKRMGKNWARIQSVALGEKYQSFEETCKAALQLFALTAKEVKHLLNKQQYQVVSHACEIAGHPLK